MVGRPSVIQQLKQQPWEDIILRLDAYALSKARRKYWPSGSKDGQSLLGGCSPQDIAREAIRRVFEGKRKWNPEKDPNLLKYLKGVIDSILSTMVKSAENREVRAPTSYEESDVVDDDDNGSRSHAVQSGGFHRGFSSPRENAQKSELLDRVLAAVNGDEDLQLLVLCLDEDYGSRADMAEKLGVSASELTNMKKRLARALDRRMLAEFRNGSGGQ